MGKLKNGSPLPNKLYLQHIMVDDLRKEFKGSIKFNGNPVSWNPSNVEVWALTFPYGNAVESRTISCNELHYDVFGTQIGNSFSDTWTLSTQGKV